MATSRAPDSAPSIQISGRLAATQDGQELDLGGLRQRAMLGILVAARRGMVAVQLSLDVIRDRLNVTNDHKLGRALDA